MSAAPYWGQLPGPKIIKHQRIPDDDGDTSLAASAGLRANRSSVQTARSDVPTETTFSPQDLESPTSPTFPSHGLAPRPPSFQRALADSGLSEAPVRSSRRSSSNPHHRSNYAGREPAYAQNSQPLPASFRLQQGRVASTSAVPAPKESGGADQLKAHKAAGTMDVDLGDSYPRFNNGSTHPYGATAAPGPSNPSRRASIGGAERRKKSAQASPLQKLELTLGSMTKEEKRARMEAAERRARERQARERYAKELYAMQPRQPAAEAVRALAGLSIDLSANPLVQRSASPPDAEPILQASSTQASEPDISQEDPVFRDQTVSYAPPPRPLPTEPRRPSPLIPDEPEEEEEEEEPQPTGFISTYTYDPEPVPEPVLPKRNLSFRERTAAQEDARFVTEQESRPPQEKAQEKPKRRFSLTRSGSNKLKKNPPDDPWYRLRMEAERKSLDGFDRQPPQQPPQPLPQQLPQHRAPAIASDPSRRYGAPPITQAREAPPAQGNRGAAMYAEDYDVQGIQRRATEPVQRRQSMSTADPYSAAASIAPVFQRDPPTRAPAQEPAMPRQSLAMEEGYTTEGSALPRDPQTMQPGDGLYSPPEWLDEWRKAPVGILSGHMLNLGDKSPPSSEKNKAWWEDGGRRRSGSFGSTPRKAEAYDGEYDDTNSTTRFKPPLYLECGPLLRYCGLRQDKVATKSSRGTTGERDRELWRGSIMIVTRDGSSSYEIAPILRLFVQDMELLPAAPHYVNGELSPEYVDPIAGHPKMGRRGETLFVRPVEHLEESRDLSQVEDDDGLFESTRSPGDVLPPDGSDDYHGSYSSRRKRIDIDGEKVQKYKDIRGFRLHAEHGVTFWRFNIEIELRDKQQRIAYRINRGPAMAFWVPAKGRSMNVMFHSCNGFSIDVNPDDVSGPDPMWRDVLNTHQTRPFHVMVGGGNQIYNDSIVDDCSLFMEWLDIKNPTQRRNAPFTPEMQDQLEDYYLDHYCQWFSSGLFGLANSQIPMVNICNDHDFYDSFGSYPYRDMKSPVMSGVGAVAFKYYMLFQHQSIMPETDKSEQSWVTGIEPGPFVNELSRSVYVSLGSRMALLAADTRTERTEQDIITDKTWEKIINRLYAEVRRGQVDHLLVVLPVPIAYPRLAWLEKAAMDPIKSLGRRGLLGKALNDIDSGTQVIDDLSDHWTAKNHKAERKIVIEDLQDLAIDKSLRITILSGDVQLAAAGQLYSNPKMNLPKHKDPRYMPNIVSSGITDSPPTNLMADVINRRDKIHHLDKETDEAMIPLFETGVDGKPRNNKRLLPHRNWCSIRQWEPGSTPPPSPPESSHEDSATPPPPSRGGSLLRRLSFSGSRPRLDMSRESVRGPRPPIANTNPGGGLFRSLSRRNSTSDADRPGKLTRTLSWGRGDGDAVKRPGFLSGLMRRSSQSRPSIADSNGQWAPESDIEDYDSDQRLPGQPRPMGLRGGGVHDEYSDGDEANFTTRPPPRAQTFAGPEDPADEEFVPKPFHRTPTGLTTKQLRKAENFEVDLEGGLDVCFNVEVNCKDPTGITVPYRLLVPKLFYEYTPDDALPPDEQPTGLKRLLSLSKKKEVKEPEPEPPAPERESPPNHYPPSSLPPQFRVLPQPSTAQASHGRQGYP